MSTANINAEELTAMQNSDFLYTKARVISKLTSLMSDMESDMSDIIKNEAPQISADLTKRPGKLSRGENYRLLPYLVFDYPRYFKGENVFAIRTMFWWGNYFSITFHVGGSILDQYRQQIEVNLKLLDGKQYYICVADNPWDYHFEKDNYVLLDEADIEKQSHKQFMKISYKLELKDLPILKEKSLRCVVDYCMLLKNR